MLFIMIDYSFNAIFFFASVSSEDENRNELLCLAFVYYQIMRILCLDQVFTARTKLNGYIKAEPMSPQLHHCEYNDGCPADMNLSRWQAFVKVLSVTETKASFPFPADDLDRWATPVLYSRWALCSGVCTAPSSRNPSGGFTPVWR